MPLPKDMDLFDHGALWAPFLILAILVILIPITIKLFQKFLNPRAKSQGQDIQIQSSFWLDSTRRLVEVSWKEQQVLLLLSSKNDQVIAIEPKKAEDKKK